MYYYNELMLSCQGRIFALTLACLAYSIEVYEYHNIPKEFLMAGRFLLIEFEDENTAEALRAQIDSASLRGKKYRVVGMFSRPGPTFCGCGNWITSRGTSAKVKRGAKFGWSVCLICKKPVPVMSFLKNLILPHQVIDAPQHTIAGQSMGFYTYGMTAVTLGTAKFESDS